MPKASTENTESDPRIARAILSAPYPLPSVRARPYIVYRSVPHPISHPTGPHGRHQAIAFVPNAPYFYGTNPGGSQPPPPNNDIGLSGSGVWPFGLAVPNNPSQVMVQTAEQRLAAEQLDEALRSPMDISDTGGPGLAGQGDLPPGPLRIAHEIGKITSRAGISIAPKGPPQSLNLLTSTYQTILPRSLLEFKHMHDALATPPTFTSSTTFFTGVTAGGARTARISPTTPANIGRSVGGPISPPRPKKYGQRERESSGDDTDGNWSSDETITKRKFRSPISPRLETPSTPRVNPSRLVRVPPYLQELTPARRPTQHKRFRRESHNSSSPLFLGQTNLSPFAYDLSRRRRHPGSGSTMSLLGVESDASTVIRLPKGLKQREGRYPGVGGGLFWKADVVRDKGKGRMGRVEEEEIEVARKNAAPKDDTSCNATPRQSQLRLPQTHDHSISTNVLAMEGRYEHPQRTATPIPAMSSLPYSSFMPLTSAQTQHPSSPERPYSPQPISIDPQSASLFPSSWPQPGALPPAPQLLISRQATNGDLGRSTDLQQRGQQPFSKACHNILLVQHRQAARRRRLLLDYHRRTRAEAEEEDERMQVDTPAVTTFAASQAAQPNLAAVSHSLLRTQIAYAPQDESRRNSDPLVYQSSAIQLPASPRQEVAIRNIATIARVDLDSCKPARKRRRDLSPESTYQPFAAYHPDLGQANQYQIRQPTIATQLHHGFHSPRIHSQLHSLQPHYHPENDPSGSRMTASTSLLPSVEIRTPPTERMLRTPDSPLIQRPPAGEPARGVYARRGSAEAYGHFEFERSRAEETGRRSLEEVKDQRRDAWLEEIGIRRASKTSGNQGRRR